jgi:PAS domain S-box-containing protein
MVGDREKSAANRLPKADDVRRKVLTSSSAQSTLALTVTSLSDGRIVDVNDGFVRLSGYAREEAIGWARQQLGRQMPI